MAPPKVVVAKNKRNTQPKGKNATATGPAAKTGSPVAGEMPKKLFAGWTGKVPATQLSELCQRSGWNKPEYFTKKIHSGFLTAVSISRKDPKNTTQKERVHFEAPELTAQPTALESKHMGATYALHRLASHLSLHRALPPIHREMWAVLEDHRNQEGDEGAWRYRPDPFTEKITRDREKEDRERERNKRQVEAERNAAKGGPSDWVKTLPEVKMSQEMRSAAETIIKQATQDISLLDPPTSAGRGKGGSGAGSKGKPSATEAKHITKSLVQKGFREQHVLEALKYTGSEERALNWLCVHVPEDDLPRQYWRKEYKASVTTSKHTTDSLAREKAVDRLSRLGFSRKACDAALQAAKDHEGNALLELCNRLVSPSTEGMAAEVDASVVTQEDMAERRSEEKATLEAIYGEDTFTPTGEMWRVMCSVDGVDGDVEIQVHFPPLSTYPFTSPPIVLLHPGLPTYIRLAAIRQLTIYARTNLIPGDPMVFDLVCWVQQHLPSLIRDPPPLLDLPSDADSSAGGESTDTSRASSPVAGTSAGHGGGRGGRGGGRHHRSHHRNAAKLKEAALAKMGDEAWKRMQKVRAKLPSAKSAAEVVEAINGYPVSIICGETGCGKTTQVPQFLLDAAILAGKGDAVDIVCTQPRRISAIGVAERVAAERVERIGDQVGYAVKGMNKQGRDTQVLFCTTGILLRRLQSDPLLAGVSHIIIDEVHERSVDSDLLLILLKRLLARKQSTFHLVLMSATANAELFASYFPGHVPIISIPGFTHPVVQHYMDDYLRDINTSALDRASHRGPPTSGNAKEIKARAERYRSQGFDQNAVTCLMAADEGAINYGMVAEVVRKIGREDPDKMNAILIFMPGVPEIRRCVDALASTGAYVMPLHANLSAPEQARVFAPAPSSAGRKIIVATNVAETSITIDGIVYVLDTGRVKETQIDERCEMMRLVETWTSRASARQRQGRAGRTRPGVCYKLFTRQTEERRMPAATPPEILRMPLPQVCLQIKGMGVTDAAAFLKEALDAPNVSAVETAMVMLEEAGVLEESGRLTSLGKHMVWLPVDFRLAKMLIYGAIFRCVTPMLTVVARLSGKSPFVCPMDKRDEANKARKSFETGQSDLLTDLKAFEGWSDLPRRDQRQYAEHNFLSTSVLFEMDTMRRQLKEILYSLSFIYSASGGGAGMDENAKNLHLLRAIIVAGLYPHILKVKSPAQRFNRVIGGTIEREKEAKEHKMYPIRRKTSPVHPGRVFLHPSSILFGCTRYEPPFVAYFSQMALSDKVFVHDGTVASLYGLLLFGGSGGGGIKVDHARQTLSIGEDIHMHAWARIGVLFNEIRLLLDRLLDIKMNNPDFAIEDNAVTRFIVELLGASPK